MLLKYGILPILLLAICLRFYGINWDQQGLFHPDERAILFHVNDMEWPSLSDVGVLFDAENSPMNPRWFPYGSLPLYAVKVTQTLISPIVQLDFWQLRILGRTISALSDTGTVLMVFLLGRRLYGHKVGLLASLLTSVTVLHVQLSHFYAVDTYLTFFLISAIYFMVRMLQDGGLKYSFFTGVFIALALASKISVLPIFASLLLVYVVIFKSSNRALHEGSVYQNPNTILSSAAVVLVSCMLTFFVTTPYAILDWYKEIPCHMPFDFLNFLNSNYFVCDIGAQYDMVRGQSGLPFTQQYVGTTAFWYQITQLSTFGLGLPLGILAWTSVVFTSIYYLVRPNRYDLLILSWVIPYFLLTGYLEVKFLRYMLPMTPFIIIMCSRMLLLFRAWMMRHKPEYVSLVNWGLIAVVLITGVYAIAYLGIYSDKHTAVKASQWIQNNVDKDSTILMEHWEEQIPNLHGYRTGCGNQWDDLTCMRMYDADETVYPDGRDKMEKVVDQLANGDYLVLFSNRLYGTIPRLPQKYPESGKYYRELFQEHLGYKLTHVEMSYPNIAGVSFADNTFVRPNVGTPIHHALSIPDGLVVDLGYADESFSVYDHPKILIFENRARFTADTISERISYGQSAIDSEPLTMSRHIEALQQSHGSWASIYTGNVSQPMSVFLWLAFIYSISWLGLPLTLLLFKSLPDMGYLLSKPLSILVVAFCVWLLSSLQWMSFSRDSVLLCSILLGVCSMCVLYTGQLDVLGFLKKKAGLVVLGEVLFISSFLVFLLIRAANPDLWHPFQGGEKPMEMAYLNATVRSSYMPPYDPWFSGGFLNYYYYGFFIVATLIKVTGILPEIAFNLAIPLFFAFTTTTTFCLVYNLTALRTAEATFKPIIAGFIAVYLVALIGNLDGLVQTISGILGVILNNQPFGEFDFWRSSRAIPPGIPSGHEITEFPFFTFLFGDLHAHLISMPFTILSLLMTFNLVLRIRNGVLWFTRMVLISFLALTLGSILAINSWDFPCYLILAGAGILIGEYSVQQKVSSVMIGKVLLQWLGIYWLSTTLFGPFIGNYHSFYTGLTSSSWQTPLTAYLGIHGVFLFLIGTSLIIHSRLINTGLGKLKQLFNRSRYLLNDSKEHRIGSPRSFLFIAAVLSLSLTLIANGYVTAIFLTVLIALTIGVGIKALTSSTDRLPTVFVMTILIMGFGIGIGVDLVTIQGDIGRMNTVFKFYNQAWILLAIASAYMLWEMRFGLVFINTNRPQNGWLYKKNTLGIIWLMILLLLLLSHSIYMYGGTKDRLRDRMAILPMSLNGLQFMTASSYSFDNNLAVDTLHDDYQAIKWMRSENIQGSPVVLEGQGQLYRTLHSRISVYTGLPTVLGWDNHQGQQRGYTSEISQRISDINTIYSTTDTGEALRLLRKYDVKYIYIGDIERHYYASQGLNKFEGLSDFGISLVYSNPSVSIFELS